MRLRETRPEEIMPEQGMARDLFVLSSCSVVREGVGQWKRMM